MTIPNSAIKYGLGVTYIKDSGTYKPLKGAWIEQSDGTWAPVKTGWVCHDDGTWERIYPTPKGIFTPNVAAINAIPYQRYTDTPKVVNILNTGDYDLTINNIVINDSTGNYSTFAHQFPSLPITLAPNQSTNISTTIYGSTVGSFAGNLYFTNYIGYFGYSNVSLPVNVTVRPDYNGIATNPTTLANLYYYEYEGTTNYSYSSPGSYSFTIPSGTNYIAVTLVGGGGGGGGNDSQLGHTGYAGHAVTGNLAVSTGDTIQIYVGDGGSNGYTGSGNGGGAGGYSADGYGGGAGGNAGPAGSSGSGGGGGAATVLKKNGTIIAVAAGGGGGGGGGNGRIFLGYEQTSDTSDFAINYYQPVYITDKTSGTGKGQVGYASNGTTYGGAGAYKGGDGGGAGGGGGGQYGGQAGSLVDGDNGAYSGSDGADLVPSGWTSSRSNNGGGVAVAGGAGSASVVEYGYVASAEQTITITNSGNGADLNIANVTTANGYVQVVSLANTNIGFNWDTRTGNTTTMVVAPIAMPSKTYTDTIIINSDAQNARALKIPVTINVIRPSGHNVFETPGVHYWTVPDHVHRITMFAVAGGGGGGGGVSNNVVLQGGGGGGGGSGGYSTSTDVAVTPGETLTITVGDAGTTGRIGQVKYYTATSSSWSSFMNSHAVWVSPDGISPLNTEYLSNRVLIVPTAGYYTFAAQADNIVKVLVDGYPIITSNSAATSTTANVFLAPGTRSLAFRATNTGGIGGFAVTVQDSTNTIIWDTRTLLDPGAGQTGQSTTISGSFGTITVGGGSPGGSAYNDGSAPGNSGYDGGGYDTDDDDGEASGGGGCFLPHTLIRMADGTEKPISTIQVGDMIVEALTNKPTMVIGVKTREHDTGKWVFALGEDETPYITEEHPWYNDDDQLCAISTLCTEQAPWLGDVKIVEVANKVKLSNPVMVYNLMLSTGESHYANGLRVNNIVKNGGAWVMVHKGLMDQDTYESWVYNLQNQQMPVHVQKMFFNGLQAVAQYVLTHDTVTSRTVGRLVAWGIKHRSTIEKPLVWWVNTRLRNYIVKKLFRK